MALTGGLGSFAPFRCSGYARRAGAWVRSRHFDDWGTGRFLKFGILESEIPINGLPPHHQDRRTPADQPALSQRAGSP
jgi:hypothetical protein